MSIKIEDLMAQATKPTADLLDIATKIAISAYTPSPASRDKEPKPSVNKNTIENLLTYMQSKKSIPDLLAYILRQTGRREIDRNTAKLLLNALKDLKNTEEDIKKALELLGLVKWIYETLAGLKININQIKNVNTFQELVNELTRLM